MILPLLVTIRGSGASLAKAWDNAAAMSLSPRTAEMIDSSRRGALGTGKVPVSLG